MKSSEMEISVYRGPDGTPRFNFPKDWSSTYVMEQIGELCCVLAEELEEEKIMNSIYKNMLIYDQKVGHIYE